MLGLLFLFTLGGYQVIFSLLKKQADLHFAAESKKGDSGNTFTVEIDLNMPYQVQSSPAEPASGEIEVNGKIYRFVKRELTEGKLILLCVADDMKTKLHNAELQLSGWSQEGDNNNSNTAKNLMQKLMKADYNHERENITSVHVLKHCLQSSVYDESIPLLLLVNAVLQPPDDFGC